MFSEHQLQWMAERVSSRLTEVNTLFLKQIGNKIKQIGKISHTDAHKLTQMLSYSGDLAEITAAISSASGKNIEDINEIFGLIAKDNYAFSEALMKARGVYVPFEQNSNVQNLIRSYTRSTANEYFGLTQTSAFCVYNNMQEKIPTSLSETYQQVIEKAVAAASTGESSYQSQMRQVLRDLADSGLRTLETKDHAGRAVDYATGYSRRLDTAVRQNLLWGMKQANLGYQEQIGEQFGADGYEIDYHAHPRPSHADMGGRQFAVGKARTVDGVYYPSFEEEAEPRLKDYGCLHFKWPIILGISEPAYSKDQLAAFKAADNRTFEFEGKKYTPYQASQVQRQLETAIRHQKDRSVIAAAAGDKDLRLEAQSKIDLLTGKYKAFSDASGLPTKAERMTVSGYRKIKIENPENTRVLRGNGIDGKQSADTNGKAYKWQKTQQGEAFDKSGKSGIMKSGRNFSSRNMAMGLRRPPDHILTENEIKLLREDIRAIGADESVFRFNEGRQTGYFDQHDIVFVRGDVLPDLTSKHPRDIMSSRAVLAHEYYGHRTYRGTKLASGSWNDEFRASYMAAKNAPNLSDADRRFLLLDALERAKEQGITIRHNNFIRSVLYAY